MVKRYFYSLLARYLAVFIRHSDLLLEHQPRNDRLTIALRDLGHRTSTNAASATATGTVSPDYVVLHGNLHYARDIQELLRELRSECSQTTRVLVLYYSAVWRPLMALASRLGIRETTPEQNWVAPSDVENFARLCGFEQVTRQRRILLPFYIPLFSELVNRWLAPLPLFRQLTLVNLALFRPVATGPMSPAPSVSIVVPARNERGNIEHILQRVPCMGPNDELIFVEGHSSDGTWEEIERCREKYRHSRKIKTARQDGKGKADAVYKGFSLAENEILMILDADITVPPEDLPKFYRAITERAGDFINGSRLVYPMEDQAMRFFNLCANKLFAIAFTFVLDQPLKDTLCGTKVFTRGTFDRIVRHREYFGDFDPFGDFDLLFGSARMGHRIVEIPIRYASRAYGETNIHRWRHGLILLRMLLVAATKLKFV